LNQNCPGARLIAFTTDVIVPPDILDHLGYGAYNFHPGPPHFPGWAPALFAIHRRATEFGLATHTEPLPELSIRWSGKKTSRRSYAALCGIPQSLSKKVLD
jgi:hypothetical protein